MILLPHQPSGGGAFRFLGGRWRAVKSGAEIGHCDGLTGIGNGYQFATEIGRHGRVTEIDCQVWVTGIGVGGRRGGAYDALVNFWFGSSFPGVPDAFFPFDGDPRDAKSQSNSVIGIPLRCCSSGCM